MNSPSPVVLQLLVQADQGNLAAISAQLQRSLGNVRGNIDVGVRGGGDVANLNRALGATQQTLNGLNPAAVQAAGAVRTMATASIDATGAVNSLSAAVGRASRNLVAYQLAAGSIANLAGSLRSAVSDAIQFEATLTRLGNSTINTGADLRGITGEIARLSTSLGVPANALAEMAVSFRRTGATAAETRQALEGLARASLLPGFGDLGRRADVVATGLRSFGLAARDTESYLGGLNAAASQFGGDAGSIATGVARLGRTFADAGGNIHELIGLIAAARATTRESSESIAASLRVLFGRLQNPAVAQNLRELGIELRHTRAEAEGLGRVDLSHQFVGPMQALERLSEGLASLRSTDPRYAEITRLLGGNRELPRLLPLLQQFGEATRAAGVAQAGQAGLVEDSARVQATLASRIDQTRQAWENLVRGLVGSGTFQALARDALSFASSLAEVAGYVKPLIPLVTALGAVKLVGSAGSLFGQVAGGFVSPQRRALGGVVHGPGGVDQVPAALTSGEYVLPVGMAQSIGYDRLDAMRQRYLATGQVEHFARGGLVGYARGGRIDRRKWRGIQEGEAQGPPILPPEVAERLVFRNYPELLRRHGTRQGGRFEEHVLPGTLEAATSFNPHMLTDEATGRAFTVEDVDSGKLDKLFQRFTTTNFIEAGAYNASRNAKRRAELLQDAVRSGRIATQSEPGVEQVIDRLDREERQQRTSVGVTGSLLAAEGQTRVGARVGSMREVLAARRAGRRYAPTAPPLLLTDQRNFPLTRVPPEPPIIEDAEFTVRNDPRLLPDLRDPADVRRAARARASTEGDRLYQKAYQDRSVIEADNDRKRQERDANRFITDPLAYRQKLREHGYSLREEYADRIGDIREDRLRGAVELSRSEAAEREVRTAVRQNRQATVGANLDPLAVRSDVLRRARAGEDVAELLPQLRRSLPPTQYATLERQVLAATDGAREFSLPKLNDFVAERQTRRDVAALGGPERLSEQTKNEVAAENAARQRAQVERELVSAQRRLVDELYRGIPIAERERVVREDVARALAGQEKVVRDANGRLLGTQSRVTRAAEAGVVAPGAGGFGYAVGGFLRDGVAEVGGFLGRTIGERSNLNTRLGRIGDRLGGRAALNTALFGLPLVAGAIDHFGGTADQAALGITSETAFRSSRGASGAIQGAVVGATLGSAVPGVGTAIGTAVGAVAGAAIGLASSLREASDEIRGARIGNAITSFADRLATLNHTVLGASPDPTAVAGALSSIRTTRGLLTEQSDTQARAGFLGFFGQDTRAFSEAQRANARQTFGPQLAQIGTYLTSQAERAGRDNSGLSVDQLLQQFRNGNAGLNRELIETAAQTRGVSVNELVREYGQSIERGQRQRAIEDRALAARTGEQGSISTWGRLVTSVEAAGDSLRMLQVRSQALAEAFDGSVNALHVSVGAEALSRLGSADSGGLRPLSLLRDVGGVQGQSLFAAGSAVDAVSRVLPTILADVARENPREAADVTTRVQGRLLGQLGYGSISDAPSNIRSVVQTVASQLDHQLAGENGLHDFFSNVRIDATHLSEQLVNPVAGPLREAASRAATLLQNESNRIGDALGVFRRQLVAIGEGQDRAATLRGAAYRENVLIGAAQAGRPHQGADFLDLDALEEPYNARQRRLTGLGNAAFDPNAIGAELARVNAAIPEAVAAQERAAGRQEFSAAAEQLTLLRDRAANLREALLHLTDVSARSAAVQERLARLGEERAARLSIGEAYGSADAAGRLQLQRGFVLANAAANRGTLDHLAPQEQALVISTLRSAGSATLTGFNGSPRANDLLANLISRSFGGFANLTTSQGAEEQRLQGVVSERMGVAATAMETLVSSQRDLSREFFGQLRDSQTSFFANLGQHLASLRLVDVTNQRAGVAAEQARQGELVSQRDLLGRVGITSTPALAALQARRDDVERLSAAVAEEQRERSHRDDALDALRNPALGITSYQRGFHNFQFAEQGYYGTLQNQLLQAGLSPAQTTSVLGRTSRQINGSTGFGQTVEADRIRQMLETEVRREFQGDAGTTRGIALSNIATITGRLRAAVPGLNTDELRNVLGGDQRQTFLNGLNSFNATTNRLESLGDQVRTTTQEFERLTAEMQRLQGLLPRPAASGWGVVTAGLAQGFAHGGPVGEDRIPAFLAEHEFVVNARSARSNLSPLNRINRANGPLYLADGGPVGDPPRRDPPIPLRWVTGGNVAPGVFSLGALPPAPPEWGPLVEARRRLEEANRPIPFGWVAGNVASGVFGLGPIRNDQPAEWGPLVEARRRLREDERQRREQAQPEQRRQAAREASVNNYYAYQAGVLERRQNLANLTDPLAAFGAGRADFQGQLSIAQRVASIGYNTSDFHSSPELQGLFGASVQRQALGFATGGVVPGVGNRDSVLSLLTPGEFVLPRNAVNRLGLGAIQHFATGGLVGPAPAGGGGMGPLSLREDSRQALNQFATSAAQLQPSLSAFAQASQAMQQALTAWAGTANALTEAMSNMPRTVSFQGAWQGTLTINGMEALNRVLPALKEMVTQSIVERLGTIFKQRMPEAMVHEDLAAASALS